MLEHIPQKSDIVEAAVRIAPHIHRTEVFTSVTLNKRFGADLFFKCENFQKAGAFKSRGAINAVFSIAAGKMQHGVATHSSGNHAQALSRAALLRKIPAHIVMPENAPRVKVDAVREYQGRVIFCKPTLKDREETLKAVVAETGAVEVHPYDNYTIIAGQATAAKELIEQSGPLDLILCPVGGGGLLAGTALSAKYFGSQTRVIACEPQGADDAYRSFKAGRVIPSVHPNTIADGLLTSLGQRNFPIIQQNVEDIVTVTDAGIVEAMKLIFERMKLVVEPSAAVVLAALLESKINIQGLRAGLILSGGNVDLKKLPFLS